MEDSEDETEEIDYIKWSKPAFQFIKRMVLPFQDRLRITWRAGAKQASPNTLIPIVAIPLAIAVAAVNIHCAVLVFLFGGSIIGYTWYYAQHSLRRTRFFCMWLFWSIVYMVILFEFTVPLLELLPEENLLLVFLAVSASYCFWRTRQRAALNHIEQSTVAEDELPDITEASTAEEDDAAAQTVLLLERDLDERIAGGQYQPNICSNCRKYVPPRTAHCTVCGACIMRRDHHSYWLDCCIGELNHKYYVAGLLLAELSLLLGANLTLTAVCHPYLVVRYMGIPFMLPDDCSEVFELYELGIAFIVAVYGVLMAAYILVVLLRQIYLISRGTTLQEFQRGQRGNPKFFWSSWKAFIF